MSAPRKTSDERLLEIEAEIGKLAQSLKAVSSLQEADPDNETLQKEFDKLAIDEGRLFQKVSRIPARTLDGLRCKARLIKRFAESGDTDDAEGASLAEDFLAWEAKALH